MDLDITDRDAIQRVLDLHCPPALINAAAQANVNRADSERELSMRVNGEGPRLLAEACAERGVRLVHISTDYVLTGRATPGTLLREDDPVDPGSIYAESKLAGEEAVLAAGATVVRVQWVYRPGARSFFTLAMERLARGEPLSLVVNQVGAPTPTSVVAPALIAAARGQATGVYQLACSGEVSAYGWIRAGAQALGLPFQVQMIRRETLPGAARPERSVMDGTRFAREFGLEQVPWIDALRSAIREECWTPGVR
jgi:dTDP-4-dehydrorhamnose reductase